MPFLNTSQCYFNYAAQCSGQCPHTTRVAKKQTKHGRKQKLPRKCAEIPRGVAGRARAPATAALHERVTGGSRQLCGLVICYPLPEWLSGGTVGGPPTEIGQAVGTAFRITDVHL